MRSAFATLALIFFATTAQSQSAAPGSAALPQPKAQEKNCAQFVDGQSVDAMIADAGSIDVVYKATLEQIVEIDSWKVQAENAKRQGVRLADIQALIDQAVVLRALNVELQVALECRMAK